MTVKTILLPLLLTMVGFGAFAQDPPPAAATNSAADRDELLRRALEKSYADKTNPPALTDPAAPVSVAPAAVSGEAPATSPAASPATRLPLRRPRFGAVPPAAAPTPAADAAAAATTSPAGLPPSPAAEPGAVVVTSSPAGAISDPDKILDLPIINWTAAPLDKVLEVYAEYVGRNLLRPATLPKVEIVLQITTRLTKLEVIHAIEAALALNQISVVNIGEKFVTVVSSTEANQIAGRINTNDVTSLPDLGSMITRVVQLKYTKPADLMNVLTPFASGKAPNPVQPIEGSGMLVLRDNVANVKRMLEMIEKVDVTMPSEFLSEVIPIKYAKAEEIASALSSVGGGTGGTVGSRPATTSSPGGAGMGGANRFGQPGYNNNPQGNLGGLGGANPVPSSGATFNDRLQNIIRKASATGDIQLLGTTKIIADIRSNSLLVFATRQDMATIKDIVDKLDVVLAQVLIETIIMDVSIDSGWSLGVSAGQPPRTDGNLKTGGVYNNPSATGGGTPLNTLNQFFNNSAAATNLTSIFPSTGGFSYFGRYGGDLDLAVTAVSSDSRVNVIQKPRIQTSHATPASIFIGETVPYISGTYYGGGYGGGNSSSYQQLRVGIQLNVTPFINNEGLVVMKIDETIDEISGSVPIDGNSVPATTSRTLSAEVAVRDRESIILGGFIRNSDNKSKSGVPFLKDIPLLGALFRSSSDTKARKELVVLMRPTVLRTPEAASMHVSVEKSRLPGVLSAERDLDKIEQQQLREAQPKKSSK